jgi:hypothetical protein
MPDSLFRLDWPDRIALGQISSVSPDDGGGWACDLVVHHLWNLTDIERIEVRWSLNEVSGQS